jgi:hypothetical protein
MKIMNSHINLWFNIVNAVCYTNCSSPEMSNENLCLEAAEHCYFLSDSSF